MGKNIWKIALVIIGIGFIIKGIMAFTGDPVEKDLLGYVNDHLVNLAKTEQKILASYSDVTGSNYKDDKFVYVSLHDTIIPKYSAFLDTLKAITPKTKEVQTLHNKYIAGAEIELSAFKQALHSIEKQDAQEVAAVNVKLNEAKKVFAEFNTTMDSLAADHDVKLVKNEKK